MGILAVAVGVYMVIYTREYASGHTGGGGGCIW